MGCLLRRGLLLLVFALGMVHGVAIQADGQGERLNQLLVEPFTGDLERIKKRALIRVLVSYNRANYFLDGPKAYGLEYELMEQFRRFLNKGVSKQRLKIDFIYLPTPFSRLIDALNAGKGDIIAAGMTVTPEREKRVAFSKPYLTGVAEILVASSKAKPLQRIEDLSGEEVYLLRGSSYVRHLKRVNQQLKKRGITPVIIREVDEHLQTEDLLELANASVIDFTVADDHVARLWKDALPQLHLYPDIKINVDGRIAWAVRNKNPQLLKRLNSFVSSHKKGSLLGNILFRRYYEKSAWVKDPKRGKERVRLDQAKKYFKRYAEEYGFDWLKIAAIAYQESELQQSRKSPAGAIGIMQIKRSTAADKHVSIKKINKLENNIHAGVKYLAFLRERYFSDPAIPVDDQTYLAFAAYNAGPRQVARMRNLTRKMGLNPDRWFGNVEMAALRLVGQETVRYVRNVLKYYTAYRISFQNMEKRSGERKSLCQEEGAGNNDSCR
jgi:membrane-bound lytic murein transglycosylase MltF